MSSRASPPGRPRQGATFLGAALRSPRAVGTLLPSGPALARRLACVVPPDPAPGAATVVVELGAGTGEVTRFLAERTSRQAHLIAIERDPHMADTLRARQLGADVVTADVHRLPDVLAERGIERVDAIVSVLPWTVLPAAEQRRLVEMLAGALAPDGVFTAAAYSAGYWTAPARRFRAELRRCFQEVLATRTMWAHLPPAMSYVARRPVP